MVAPGKSLTSSSSARPRRWTPRPGVSRIAARIPGTSGRPPTRGSCWERRRRSSSRSVMSSYSGRRGCRMRPKYDAATRDGCRDARASCDVPRPRTASGRACARTPSVTARTLTVGGGTYPLVLPSIRDPRLHVAAVIITIHVLGQVGLHFRVSVPQILAAILTCAIIEIALTFRAEPGLRVAGQRDAHRQRRRADPARRRHAAGRALEHRRLVRLRRRRRVLAADQVRHQVPRLARLQPVEHRAGRRVRRARQHARGAARLLVGAAQRLDAHRLRGDHRRRAADHPAPAAARARRRRSG